MDTLNSSSFENYAIKKAELRNVVKLLHYDAYRNDAMSALKVQLEKELQEIERLRANNMFEAFLDVFDLARKLGAWDFDINDEWWYTLEHHDLIRVFGLEVAGPSYEVENYSGSYEQRCYLQYYDDAGKPTNQINLNHMP